TGCYERLERVEGPAIVPVPFFLDRGCPLLEVKRTSARHCPMSPIGPKRTLGSESARLTSLRKAWSSRRAHAATPVHHTWWRHGHRMAALGARAAAGTARDRVPSQYVGWTKRWGCVRVPRRSKAGWL